MTKHVEENNVCLPVVRAEGRYICACVAAQWEGSRKITTFLVGQSGGAETDVLACPSGGGPGETNGQADHAEVVRPGSSIDKMAQLARATAPRSTARA